MKLDASALKGAWPNTHADTQGIARVDFTTRDGALAVRAHAAGPEGSFIDWGETRDTTLYAIASSAPAAGFRARYDHGFSEATLLGYVNRGVLVLSCFSVFKDGSRRVNSFSREYHSRVPAAALAGPARQPSTVADRRLARLEDLQVPTWEAFPANLAPLCGTWVNSKAEGPEVMQIRARQHEGGVALRVRSLGPEGPIDWPEAHAQVFQSMEDDSRKGLALRATFDPGFMEIHAELRFTKGILVLATWNGSRDQSGRASYFTREFFHRVSG